MASWREIESDTPQLARRARNLFDAHRHKTLATLRRDGSPRISGIEATVALDELWIGSMPDSLKAADLRRDPRFALHSGSADPSPPGEDDATASVDTTGWNGDAKAAGRAIEILDQATKDGFVAALIDIHPEMAEQAGEPFDLFRLDVTELVTTAVGDPADHLVIVSWHQGRGTTVTTRS